MALTLAGFVMYQVYGFNAEMRGVRERLAVLETSFKYEMVALKYMREEDMKVVD